MELLLRVTETKDGVKCEENITLAEDVLFTMTPPKLWEHYLTVLERLEKHHNDFKKMNQIFPDADIMK